MRRCMHIYCSSHCRCNLSALHHSIDRFDTRLGQRIAHADDDAIALTARRLPRRKRARCMCVCGQRVSPAVASNRYRAHVIPKRHTSRYIHMHNAAPWIRARLPHVATAAKRSIAPTAVTLHVHSASAIITEKTARLHRLEFLRARAHILPPIYTARLSVHLRAHI